MIDEKRSSAMTISAYTNDAKAERAELKLSAADAKLFQEYYTVLLKGVNGYDSTGQTKLETDLMCYVVSQNETNNMHKGRTETHDPIAMMQSIATAYGQDKADKIFNIIKQQEEKDNENNG